MPIEFRCSQCGRLLWSGDDTAGKSARCPQCGALSAVPSPATAGGATTAPEMTLAPPPMGELPVTAPVLEQPENPYQSPTQYGRPVYPPGRSSTNSAALISLILGCCGFPALCLCMFLALPVGITGLVLGIGALKSESRGMAIAGIVLCSIQIVLVLAYLAVVAFVFLVAPMQAP